jgi:hypothetical protein
MEGTPFFGPKIVVNGVGNIRMLSDTQKLRSRMQDLKEDR